MLPLAPLAGKWCGQAPLREDRLITKFFLLAFTGDLEKEKRRLQNILATGKDEVEQEEEHKVKKNQALVQTKEEEKPEPDRFEECKSLLEEGRWEAGEVTPSEG